MKETDLYKPVKIYLENQGYQVSSEVKNCDIVARNGEELIIVELKRNFSLQLLIQAVKRKDITESVYAAVSVPRGKKYPSNFGGIKNVLRRLEIGLILVHFMKTKTKIELVLHPVPVQKRRSPKKLRAIIREIDGRYAEFNTGGSPSTVENITAYKQEAIRIAAVLNAMGKASPKQLRQAGCGEKTQRILSMNVYGWFERVDRGVYTLSAAGRYILPKYRKILSEIIPLPV